MEPPPRKAAPDLAALRIEASEIESAIDLLDQRIETSDTITDRRRWWGAIVEVLANDPDWVSQWTDNGTLYRVPGPKLLELLAPMENVRAALGR